MLSNFCKSESGNVAVISALSMLTLVVLAGGTIDISNVQQDKERASYIVDGAALAAAAETKRERRFRYGRSMATNLSKSNTTSDSASSNDGVVTTIQKLSTGNFEITATMKGTTENAFLGIIGMPETDWTVSSTSYVNLIEAEVFLVLDVSASMEGTKLTEMKAAAQDFVTSLDPFSDNNSHITISVIPFAETVNMGAEADIWLHPTDGLDYTPDFVGCFRTGDSRPLGSLQAYPTGEKVKSNGQIHPRCPSEASAALLNSSDGAEILDYIANLELGWGTGSNTGLLWANRMLNNDWRNSVTFESKPFETVTDNTQKFVLFLTDGKAVWSDPDQNGINGTQDAGDIPINNTDEEQSFREACADITADPTVNLYSIGYTSSGGISAGLEEALKSCTSENGAYYVAGTANVDEIFAKIQQEILDVYLVR